MQRIARPAAIARVTPTKSINRFIKTCLPNGLAQHLCRVQFKDVIGQEEVISRLVQMVEQNRLSHALLFSGREGYGVLPLALNFGQWMVSQAAEKPGTGPDLFGGTDLFGETAAVVNVEPTPGADGISLQAAQLMHPDLHFSYPVIPRKSGDKPVSTDYISLWRDFIKQKPYGSVLDWLQSIGAENQQGNITAEECNDIIRKLSLKTFSSRYKVLVMWLPEYLGKEGNKLLKLIEEPPPDTLFILATHNEEMVLPTIRSRCQAVKIPPIATTPLQHALESRLQFDPIRARQVALTCNGSYLEALELVQHSDDDLNAVLRDWLNASLNKGPKAHERYELQVKMVNQLAGLGRERQKQLLRYFMQLLEQSMRMRLAGEDAFNLPDAEKEFSLRLNKIAGLGQQKAIAELLNRNTYYIERNANAKLLFHALTLKLRSIVLEKNNLLVG